MRNIFSFPSFLFVLFLTLCPLFLAISGCSEGVQDVTAFEKRTEALPAIPGMPDTFELPEGVDPNCNH